MTQRRAHSEMDIPRVEVAEPDSQPPRLPSGMSWGKVVTLAGSTVLAVVGATAKLSADATTLQSKVTALEDVTRKHEAALAQYQGTLLLVPSLAADLKDVTSRVEAFINQSIATQQRMETLNTQFWNVTWPALEARFIRLEHKLDRIR